MKSFKDIVKETVAEPKGGDEKRFKRLHTDNVTVYDYGSKSSERAARKYAVKKPRRADYQKGEDQAAYDQAYAEEASLEEEMTDAQMKKREEIVKELKKKKDEFKDNYGDDWENVMYATATKTAMKESLQEAKMTDDHWVIVKRNGNFYSAKSEIKKIVRASANPPSQKVIEKHGGDSAIRVGELRKKLKGKKDTGSLLNQLGEVKESFDQTLSEDPWEEIPMMERQLEFICYAAEEVNDYLSMGVDPEEWFQNKLAHVHGQMRTLHAYVEGDKRVRGAKDADSFHMGEQNELSEEVIDDLKKILKDKTMDEVTLSNGDKLDVDVQTANVLLKVYGALNGQNKEKFADALGKNEKMFMKMLDFADSKVK